MDEPAPDIAPESRRCAVCGVQHAPYGFSPPGFPLQPAEAWYCGTHRQEGERAWAACYRPSSGGVGWWSLGPTCRGQVDAASQAAKVR
jgi:hypothetical protein